MTCSGCSGAITRVLENAKKEDQGEHTARRQPDIIERQSPGVDDFSVSLETQEVLVTGTMPYEDLLAKLKKTGKEVGVV
jgi:copper chaperone